MAQQKFYQKVARYIHAMQERGFEFRHGNGLYLERDAMKTYWGVDPQTQRIREAALDWLFSPEYEWVGEDNQEYAIWNDGIEAVVWYDANDGKTWRRGVPMDIAEFFTGSFVVPMTVQFSEDGPNTVSIPIDKATVKAFNAENHGSDIKKFIAHNARLKETYTDEFVKRSNRQCLVKPCPELAINYGHAMQEWFELPDGKMLFHFLDNENGKEEWGFAGGSPANNCT